MSLVSLVVIRQSLQLRPLEQSTLQGLRLQQCFLPQYVTGQSCRNQAVSTASSSRAVYTTRSTTVAVFPPSVSLVSLVVIRQSLQLRPLEQSTLVSLVVIRQSLQLQSSRAVYTTRSTTAAVFPPSVCHWSVLS